MYMTDLEAMPLAELKQLQKDVARAIAGYDARQRADARAALEAHAKDLGFSLAELVSVERSNPRAKTALKYRNPSNPSDT